MLRASSFAPVTPKLDEVKASYHKTSHLGQVLITVMYDLMRSEARPTVLGHLKMAICDYADLQPFRN